MSFLQWVRALFRRADGDADEYEDLYFPENPYVPEAVGSFMFKVATSFTSTAFTLVEADSNAAFVALARLMMSFNQRALPDLDPVTADRGWAWEVARCAAVGFAHDTDPDHMYFRPEQMAWSYDGYKVPMYDEACAFVDAAFSGEPEMALRVMDSLRWHGPHVFPDEDAEMSGNRVARALTTMVLLNLTATYGAQAVPELMDIEGSPLAAAREEEEDD